MSKESYARGFVKAAAAAGVDPTELAKFAQERLVNDNAGIGSVADNFGTKYRIAQPVSNGNAKMNAKMLPDDHYEISSPHPGSYLEALRASGYPSRVPDRRDFIDSYPGIEEQDSPNSPISKGRLAEVRKNQARDLARYFYPAGSAPMEALVKNLIRAGEQNYKAYLETGTVPPRNSVDRTGIEKLKIPNLLEREGPATQKRVKEKFGIENMDDLIKVLQNSMVRKGPAKTKGNIA